MKKALFILMVAALLVLTMVGCGKTKVVHCDGCNKEIEVSANSNMEEDWINFCEDCAPDLDEK